MGARCECLAQEARVRDGRDRRIRHRCAVCGVDACVDALLPAQCSTHRTQACCGSCAVQAGHAPAMLGRACALHIAFAALPTASPCRHSVECTVEHSRAALNSRGKAR